MNKRLIPHVIMFVLAAAGPSDVWALDNRTEKVNEEMDCVIAAFNRKEKMSWSDVCYTDERKKSYPEKARMSSVENELDYYEGDYDYDRESDYQSSLEYLNNFMAETE